MILLDYGVWLITRGEWGARSPTSVTPINAVFGSTRHWEGPHMGDFPHESCPSKVRGIQAFHMDSKGWTDIAYTGVPCPHGYVFEGRGLWRRTAANGTNLGNNTAYAFCYLGGVDDPFTEPGKRAMKAAMNWARTNGGAGADRNDHNDWKATLCPGQVIETWGDGGEHITSEEDDEMTPDDRNWIAQQLQESEQRVIRQVVGTQPLVVAFDDIEPGDPDHWYLVPGVNRTEVTQDEAAQRVAEGTARWWNEPGLPLRVPRATLESVPLDPATPGGGEFPAELHGTFTATADQPTG